MVTHQLMSVKYTHQIVESCIHTTSLVLIWWVFTPKYLQCTLTFYKNSTWKVLHLMGNIQSLTKASDICFPVVHKPENC